MFSDRALDALRVAHWAGMVLIAALGVAAVVDWPGSDAADLGWWAAAIVQAAPVVLIVVICAIGLHIALHMPATQRPDGSINHHIVARPTLFACIAVLMLVEGTIAGAGLSDISGATHQHEVTAEAAGRRASLKAQIEVVDENIATQVAAVAACPDNHFTHCINPATAKLESHRDRKLVLLEQLGQIRDNLGAEAGYYASSPIAGWIGITSERQADVMLTAIRTYGLQIGVLALAALIYIGSPKPMIHRERYRNGIGTVSERSGPIPPGFNTMTAQDRADWITERILSGDWQPPSPTGRLTIDSIIEAFPVGRPTAMRVRQLVQQQGAARTEPAGLVGDRVVLSEQTADSAGGVVLDINRARRGG